MTTKKNRYGIGFTEKYAHDALIEDHREHTGTPANIEFISEGETHLAEIYTGIDTVRCYWRITREEYWEIDEILKADLRERKKKKIRFSISHPETEFGGIYFLHAAFECYKLLSNKTESFKFPVAWKGDYLEIIIRKLNDDIVKRFGKELTDKRIFLSNIHVAHDVAFDGVISIESCPFMGLHTYKGYGMSYREYEDNWSNRLLICKNVDLSVINEIRKCESKIPNPQEIHPKKDAFSIYTSRSHWKGKNKEDWQPTANFTRFEGRHETRISLRRKLKSRELLLEEIGSLSAELLEKQIVLLNRVGFYADVDFASFDMVKLAIKKSIPSKTRQRKLRELVILFCDSDKFSNEVVNSYYKGVFINDLKVMVLPNAPNGFLLKGLFSGFVKSYRNSFLT